MMYELPKSLTVCGVNYEIRSDFRAVLDLCTALSDVELTVEEKSIVALYIFYPAFEDMPQGHYQEALQKCFWFINCGNEEDQTRKAPKLMDWEQDFQYIVAPVNRVIGTEIRALEYLHWWSFISAYYEIGDCTFAMIVRIRDKLARGKTLDKQEREWYRQNRQRVDLRQTFSQAEKDVLKAWGV